jgi:hypothetical protein
MMNRRSSFGPRSVALFVAGSAGAMLCAIVLLLAGCSAAGTGSGAVEPGGAPVRLAWKSEDGGETGTMTATLPDGRTFSGPFTQVRSTARRESFAPFWNGWAPGWVDWPLMAGQPVTEFVTVYSGRVIANLQSPDGQHMRCRFQLNKPDAGMRGGGQGQCRLADGRTIDAVFPAT